MKQFRPSSVFLTFIVIFIGSNWQVAKVKAQTINQFDWVQQLPGEPIGTAVDGARNTYVLTAGNTLVQLDWRGRERWRQTFSDWPSITKLTTDRAGNLLLAGPFTNVATVGDSTFQLRNAFNSNTFLAKLDSTHRLIWTRQVPGPDYLEYPAGIKTDSLGYVYLLGARASGPVLVQVDPLGQRFDKQILFYLVQPAPLPTSLDTDANGDVVATLTQVGRSASYGIAQKISFGVTAWSHYVDEGLPPTEGNYNTNTVQVKIDRQRNSYVLSNYSLPDPLSSQTLESGQGLLKLDADGNRVWQKSGPYVADSARAQGLLVDPAGVAITYGTYSGKFIAGSYPIRYSTDDYIGLTQYAPNGDLRWTTQFGSPDGNDKLYQVERDANGALLLTASTTGPLTLGALSINGTIDTPAYYLGKLQPAQVQPDSSKHLLCVGAPVAMPGRYNGYFDQELTIQLSDATGQFDQPIVVGRVPIGISGSYFPGPVVPPALTLPANLPPGAGYRIRAVSSVPVYIGEPMAVTVNQSPPPPLIQQVGDEFVSNAATGNQWFTAAKQPITGATNPQFKPVLGGQYYVVATANGCPSPPSELLTYLITAVEPTPPLTDLVIYPNPATDRVRVEWTGVAATAQAEVLLHDSTGKLCRRVARSGDGTDIWLNDLPAGSYIVSVQVAGQRVNSRRLLIR